MDDLKNEVSSLRSQMEGMSGSLRELTSLVHTLLKERGMSTPSTISSLSTDLAAFNYNPPTNKKRKAPSTTSLQQPPPQQQQQRFFSSGATGAGEETKPDEGEEDDEDGCFLYYDGEDVSPQTPDGPIFNFDQQGGLPLKDLLDMDDDDLSDQNNQFDVFMAMGDYAGVSRHVIPRLQ